MKDTIQPFFWRDLATKEPSYDCRPLGYDSAMEPPESHNYIATVGAFVAMETATTKARHYTLRPNSHFLNSLPSRQVHHIPTETRGYVVCDGAKISG
jgi:hypothetical protein